VKVDDLRQSFSISHYQCIDKTPYVCLFPVEGQRLGILNYKRTHRKDDGLFQQKRKWPSFCKC
jgi:hypothetical protein